LTKRELEVLTLLAQGLSVQQISRRLSLSVHTTRGYVKTLLVKLEAHSQLEAVLVAARRGLIAAVS
jgi:DNA-binding NarL/FixJ family response regulator